MNKVHRFRLIQQSISHHMLYFATCMEKRSAPYVMHDQFFSLEDELQLKLDSLKCWFLGEYE